MTTPASRTDATPGPAVRTAPARDPEGNERLTAWAGGALLLGFAAEGATILDVHRWMLPHLWIGYALLPPVAVKVASTVYRFVRYYTHSPAYVQKGPPRLLLRVLAPLLVLDTVAVLLTGIAIMLLPAYHWQFELLHKLSFVTWFGLTAIHVLAYVWRLPRLMLADLADAAASGGPRPAALGRVGVVVAAGAAGIGGGALLLPWLQSWTAR